MFKTIVVGTDGSRNAEDALRVAADLASRNAGSVVHVVAAHKPLSPRDLAELAAELPEEFRPLLTSNFGVESVLNRAKAIFQTTDVDVEYAGVDGDPVDALLTAVTTTDADLIIVGSRGEGPARRALHGSVSTNVLHHASCSVLVVKSEH